MKNEIVKLLEKQHKITGGNCGLSTAFFAKTIKTDFSTLKSLLNELCKDKIITHHPNVHGLIFKVKK